MLLLWNINKGVVKDILQYTPEPKSVYNNVLTFIRLLESKGFVNHKAHRRS